MDSPTPQTVELKPCYGKLSQAVASPANVALLKQSQTKLMDRLRAQPGQRPAIEAELAQVGETLEATALWPSVLAPFDAGIWKTVVWSLPSIMNYWPPGPSKGAIENLACLRARLQLSPDFLRVVGALRRDRVRHVVVGVEQADEQAVLNVLRAALPDDVPVSVVPRAAKTWFGAGESAAEYWQRVFRCEDVARDPLCFPNQVIVVSPSEAELCAAASASGYRARLVHSASPVKLLPWMRSFDWTTPTNASTLANPSQSGPWTAQAAQRGAQAAARVEELRRELEQSRLEFNSREREYADEELRKQQQLEGEYAELQEALAAQREAFEQRVAAAQEAALQRQQAARNAEWNAGSPPSPVPGVLPDGWTEQLDGNGNVYYWNSITQQSQWERPT